MRASFGLGHVLLHGDKAVGDNRDRIDAALDQEFGKLRTIAWCLPAESHFGPALWAVSTTLRIIHLTASFLAGTDIYYPPFGYWIASWIAAPGVDPSTIAPYDKTGIDPASWEEMRSFRSGFLTVHYWNFFALIVAILIHIAGVVVTELREGGAIVSAMFSGQKVFDSEPRDDVGGTS